MKDLENQMAEGHGREEAVMAVPVHQPVPNYCNVFIIEEVNGGKGERIYVILVTIKIKYI